jgi:1-acyl-sn-glycerol-3-phosphate acyltransferase
MPAPSSTELAPWEPLYDAVAFGMWAYTRAAFSVETVGALEPQPGAILVATHRAETDVPLLCPSVYRQGRYLRHRTAARLSFAARDDMFERGFFAGFPPALPILVRRALYGLQAGPLLPRVRVHPVPYPSIERLRLGQALAVLPASTSLADVLPDELVEAFRERARSAGLVEPQSAADVLRGAYADLLWRYCDRRELGRPVFEQVWRRRAAEGAASIRRLVRHVRSSGEMLLVFPEGRPSPDGGIGPLQPGLDLLVRKGKPSALVPVGIAYDRMRPGCPRAVVAFGQPFSPPDTNLEAAVLAALRAVIPLTAGALLGHQLFVEAQAGATSVGRPALSSALDHAVDTARAEGRPVARSLLGPRRRDQLEQTVAWFFRGGLASPVEGNRIALDRRRLLEDEIVARAAREHSSARAPMPRTPP